MCDNREEFILKLIKLLKFCCLFFNFLFLGSQLSILITEVGEVCIIFRLKKIKAEKNKNYCQNMVEYKECGVDFNQPDYSGSNFYFFLPLSF